MKDFLDVTLLAILQGVAEFLPISSSGHLVIGKSLLGMRELGMRLDVFLHAGTLVAVAAFYWKVLVRICLRREWEYVLKVIVSAIPVGVVGLLFKDELEALFASPSKVGAALIFTGLVLTATRFLPRRTAGVTFKSAFVMGLAQAVAILPGISRSGMTLAAARGTGVDAEKGAEFSFLMSAPPIAGAAFLELLASLKTACPASAETPWGLCLAGAVLAAAVGYGSLKFLIRTLRGPWFWLFGPYCLVAGLLVFCFL